MAEAARKKLEAQLALKKKQAEDARLKAEAERRAESTGAGRETTIAGWVSYIGPGVESTGATHRIVKDGRVLALVKSTSVDLASFVGARVQVTGRARVQVSLSGGGGRVNVVDVAGIQIVFN